MKQISTGDIILMAVGVAYGIMLFLSGFKSNRLFDAFRMDTFLTTKPNPMTKKVNILFGLIILGISIYSFYSSYK